MKLQQYNLDLFYRKSTLGCKHHAFQLRLHYDCSKARSDSKNIARAVLYAFLHVIQSIIGEFDSAICGVFEVFNL